MSANRYRSSVGRASAVKAEDMGSNRSECHFFFLFGCFFHYPLPWRSVGRSNYNCGLQKVNNVDLNNDIQIKQHHTKI